MSVLFIALLLLRGYAHALALDLACEYAAEPATEKGNEDAEDNKSHFAISRAGISGGRPNDLVLALSILRSAVYRSNAATGAPRDRAAAPRWIYLRHPRGPASAQMSRPERKVADIPNRL